MKVWRADRRRWRIRRLPSLLGTEWQIELGKLRIVFGRSEEVG